MCFFLKKNKKICCLPININVKNKCIKKVNEIIKNENVTLLFVTHATGVAKEFCKRGMVMESGVITFDGNIAEAIEKYNSSIK